MAMGFITSTNKELVNRKQIHKEVLNCCAVITTFNDLTFLQTSIRSVLSQDSLPAQIIVVDDGSTKRRDKTFWDKFTIPDQVNFIYHYKENGGPSSARNIGIKLCQQTYIAFLDGDDWWFPNKLKWQISLLEHKGENYGAVYGSSVRIENGIKTVVTIMDTECVTDWNKIGKPGGFPGGAAFYTFRNKALKSINGFDEDLWSNEDFDLILRLGIQRKIIGRNIPVLNRRVQTQSLSRGHPINKYIWELRFLFKRSTLKKLSLCNVVVRFFISTSYAVVSLIRKSVYT